MKKLFHLLLAVGIAASGPAAYAQFQVSHPSIYYEEWHYSDVGMQNLTGHFITYCDGTGYRWGHPDIHNYFAYGDCPPPE